MGTATINVMAVENEAMSDYQRAVMDLSSARNSLHEVMAELNALKQREHEALARVRDAVERMGGNDPLGIVRVEKKPLRRDARVQPLVLAALPGTTAQIIAETGLSHRQVANALQNSSKAGRVVRGDDGVWTAL